MSGVQNRGTKTLRETAVTMGISHAQVIIIERRAIAKVICGLGLMTIDELPHRIRKFLRPEDVAAIRAIEPQA